VRLAEAISQHVDPGPLDLHLHEVDRAQLQRLREHLRELHLGQHTLRNQGHTEPLPSALLRCQPCFQLRLRDRTTLEEELSDSFSRHQCSD